jgi:hypothetical protein
MYLKPSTANMMVVVAPTKLVIKVINAISLNLACRSSCAPGRKDSIPKRGEMDRTNRTSFTPVSRKNTEPKCAKNITNEHNTIEISALIVNAVLVVDLFSTGSRTISGWSPKLCIKESMPTVAKLIAKIPIS